MYQHVKVAPVYRSFFVRELALEVDEPETEVVYFHLPGVKYPSHLLLFFLLGAGIEHAGNIASPLIHGKGERSFADCHSPKVKSLFAEQALDREGRCYALGSGQDIKAFSGRGDRRIGIQQFHVFQHDGIEWLKVDFGEFYLPVEFVLESFSDPFGDKSLYPWHLDEHPCGEQQDSSRHNDAT